jgi:predicted TIM-barrel fold metal-dependent hydrolase
MLAAPTANAQNAENPQVTRLLADVRDKAAVLARDADEMESLIRTDASWQTHAAMLDEVKRHVNDLGRVAKQLEESRSSASPWQQQAIDRMMPLLKELAANTTAAINHLNENRLRPTTGNYPEYLKANAATAQQLSDMISSFVRYGETRAKLEKLEQRLEVASK